MDQADPLAVLEQKILRAAELVGALRSERDAALRAAAESESLRQRLAETSRELDSVRAERDALRADKEIVRQRLEKLLEQIDAISAS